MSNDSIRFDDGDAYERFMGRWSRLAGDVFLDWLNLPPGLGWLDVGCGNGAFTEAVIDRCNPLRIVGVDPAEAQLEFARSRSGASTASFELGDAMSLPSPDDAFDTAVMALVLFFVPEPARGVAEMRRAVAPGGTVAAYAWDMLGGGFPLSDLHDELREAGHPPLLPPSVEASRLPAMRELWENAGLENIEAREITVERTFVDFEDMWNTSVLSAGVRPVIASMRPPELDALKLRLQSRFPPDRDGRIVCSARANAVRGSVP